MIKKDHKKIEAAFLTLLQGETLAYFLDLQHPVTGLVPDSTRANSPASIAVTGMAISSYICAVENEIITRENGLERILKILNFFQNSVQSRDKDASGYKGFYYHFIDMETGKRAWKCELSTIDTAILIAGILSAAHYFTGSTTEEKEVTRLAISLYERVNWKWTAQNKKSINHGWKPETGFLKYKWDKGYSEAHILYILALGAPKHAIDEQLYKNWTDTFEIEKLYERTTIHAGPLFIHQMSQLWLPLKGIGDACNKKAGFDYFENSRLATEIQQCYASENPRRFIGYHAQAWGITASDGPGPATKMVNKKRTKFFDYKARGVPHGPDDGTLSPWAVAASLPFSPEMVLENLQFSVNNLHLKKKNAFGLYASYNPSFPSSRVEPTGWVSKWQYGLNQGPIILMIENYRNELIWNLMKKCPAIISGLKKAGFVGGWLDEC